MDVSVLATNVSTGSMDEESDTSSVTEQYFVSVTGEILLKLIFISATIYILQRAVVYFYHLASSETGIHYVKHERCAIACDTNYCSFSFDANYRTASLSRIECTLKSQQACYVQAFWRVPIHSLFELLHEDWVTLRNAITTHIPAEKFSTKCACASDPFMLSPDERKKVEFKPPWHIDAADLSQKATCMRQVYPFVLLMVLQRRDELHNNYVVAMANAVHIADKNLVLPSQLIGQFLKLSSGDVGNLKNMYLSSPATSEDEGQNYELCLACYHRPVSRVFLPCRHACLCDVCFELCDKCPVCRCTSLHYIQLPDPYRRYEQ